MSNIPDDLPNPIFSIAPGEETWIREPADWWPCEPKTYVYHVPSRTLFELYPDPNKPQHEPLEVIDFRARLVHLCEGAKLPGPEEFQKLGKEALLMALRHIGLVSLTDQTAADSDRA